MIFIFFSLLAFQNLLNVSIHNLKREMSVAKNCIVSTCGKKDFNLENIKECVSNAIYSNLYKLLQVAITLPISSS